MPNRILIVGVVFGATLAYLFGNRLSNEAMAVVVGALCGITASVPVCLALFIAASRDWGRADSAREEPGGYAQRALVAPPPIVVISSPQQTQSPYPFPASQLYLPPHAPMPGAPRDFKIVVDG